MKRFAKIFLLFVFIMTSSFSFVGCGEQDHVDEKYYFNREYYYVGDTHLEEVENTIVYGEYYDTSIKISNNQFSMRFKDGLAYFKLERQSLKIVDAEEIKTYDLELIGYIFDEIEEGETPEIPVIQNIYIDISSNGAVITMPYDGKTLYLEFLKDPSKVVRHSYRFYNYIYEYADDNIETITEPYKYKFNNFIDVDFNKVFCYKDGIKYEYVKTYDTENEVYVLTLITETDDALFETATIETLIGEIKIRFKTEDIVSGVLIYNKLPVKSYPSDNESDTNVDFDEEKEGVSNDAIKKLGESAYIKIIRIVKIVLPTFIGAIVAFGLFYGISLGVKYAKAEEVEEKKKVKSSLISVVVACIIIILIVSIVMMLI